MLTKLSDSSGHSDWRNQLTQVEYAMNNTNHTTTGVSASKLLFGVEQRGEQIDGLTEYLEEKLAREPIEVGELRDQASAAIMKSQQYNSKYFAEHHAPAVEYAVGEYVVIKNVDTSVGTNKKLTPKYRGPYRITKKLDHDRYIVEDLENYQVTQMPYHGVLDSSRIKRWIAPTNVSTGEELMPEATQTG